MILIKFKNNYISNPFYYLTMTNKYNQPFPKRHFTIRHNEEKYWGFSGQCMELPWAISQGET